MRVPAPVEFVNPLAAGFQRRASSENEEITQRQAAMRRRTEPPILTSLAGVRSTIPPTSGDTRWKRFIDNLAAPIIEKEGKRILTRHWHADLSVGDALVQEYFRMICLVVNEEIKIDYEFADIRFLRAMRTVVQAMDDNDRWVIEKIVECVSWLSDVILTVEEWKSLALRQIEEMFESAPGHGVSDRLGFVLRDERAPQAVREV